MKVLIKKALISFVCVFALFSACYGDGFYGMVSEIDTELPIGYATVKMSMDGTDSYVEKLTDENGYFIFLPNELPWKAYEYNTFRITANKEGYKEYEYRFVYYDPEYLYDYNRVGYGPMYIILNKTDVKHVDNSAIIIRISDTADACPRKIVLRGERTGYYDKYVEEEDVCHNRFRFYFLPSDTYHLTIKFTNNNIIRKTMKLKKNMAKDIVVYLN